MKKLPLLLSLYLIAVLITVILYFIDNDPSYANPLHTLIEGMVASIIVFIMMCVVYYMIIRPLRGISKKNG